MARAVGQGDVIVCSKIDRLGRTMFETMETILELTQHGVSVETGDAGRPRSAHRLGCFFERPRTCARSPQPGRAPPRARACRRERTQPRAARRTPRATRGAR
ncbi:recombinase family protein [Dermacoccus abyssi]|uniref:recombinase family protein n=1 Tax=Dermacoccus abyssi TaxID=322596 RepID=UPI0038993801